MKNSIAPIVILLLVGGFLSSCIKEESFKPAPKWPSRLDRLAGIYSVYAPEMDTWYKMQIKKIQGINGKDSIQVLNFLNLFSNITEKYVPVTDEKDSLSLFLEWRDLIIDKNGKRWSLHWTSDNQVFYKHYNFLRGDTMHILYRTSDYAYWVEDSLPFEGNVYRKHVAVKIL